MADDRKIILQLEIDANKGIQNIIAVKDRIATLKKEQAGLNKETAEGKKTFEAYNAQIKALTKEQKSLELAVEKTAAGFEYETGSIAANRAELSKLTAEYKNLANPTKEQTARIRALSDTLKEQEGAIGNTSRNVGNYKEALNGISGQLGAFGPQIQQITQGFSGVTKGLQLVSGGFKTLGGAIVATGFGALLVLLGTLVTYFKNTDQGATALEGVFGALGAAVKEVSGFVAELGSRFIDIVNGSEPLGDALLDIGKSLVENVTNRFNAANVAGQSFAKLLKGDTKGAAKQANDALIQLTTGIANGTDKIQAFAAQIAKSAKEAYDYAVQLDAVNDAQRVLDITNAKSNRIVQELIITAKNKSKTDQERIELLLRANKIEEKSVNDQTALDRQRLELITKRNEREKNAINQKLERDISEAKSEEKKIQLRERALDISDDLAQEQADLEKKIIDAETSFIQLKEKNQNKISALEESIAADRQKAYDKYVAQLKEINALELSLDNQRQARVIANLDYEISKVADNADQKILLLRLKAEEEKKLQKELLDERLAQLTTDSLQEEANIEAINLQKIAAEEETNQNLINIERKFQDDLTAVNDAAEKKRTEDTKKESDKRNKQREEDFKQLLQVVNATAAAFSNANTLFLNESLQKNDDARNKELQRSAKDKDTQDRINKKYDKIAEKEKRKAARTDLDIKTGVAIATGILGVIQALGSAPPPVNFVLAALTGGAVAVEVAALQSQKNKLAKGGLIKIGGKPHSAGGTTFRGTDGTVFEAERDEVLAVVNKHDAPKLSYLSGINSLHGTPFYGAPNRAPVGRNHFADGGMVARGAGGGIQEQQQQINAMQNTIENLQIVVGVKDIVTGVEKKARVVDRANVTK